jgi:LPS sulfotransferase NodH
LLWYKTQPRDSTENTPKIATVGTYIVARQLPLKLRNSKTNRRTFRNKIEENLVLDIPLKTDEGVEQAIAEFNNVVQTAVWSARPDSPQAECQEYPSEAKGRIKWGEIAKKTADESTSWR